MEKLKPTFWVRDVPVYGDVILSPMAGYSDVPYRAICRAFGSAMQYTEFVPVEMLLGRPNPIWRALDKQPDEYPMVFQIFGNDAHLILRAAQKIEAWGPDIIDINMGCSTRRVSGRGAGVGMMPQPELVAQTFSLLSQHLRVPVSGKIRLGWDERQNYLEIGRIMADNGASLIALHGRTKEQKYDGQANWQAIARLKQAVNIPVIGSGDVTTPDDIEQMKAETGCDGVMVGRGAIGNPWIFARRNCEDLTAEEWADTIRWHGQEMVAYHGEKVGMTLFRKHLKKYVAGRPHLAPYEPQLMQITQMIHLNHLLDEMVTTNPKSFSGKL
ncbi:MAG: tRNA-dihydrouridine synthase family protein [Anaerolineae bacterium]|nr:tRNA-dihydrouridine synthase family protein [Anaerolineae bacterium]